MTADLPDALVAHFAQREAERTNAVAAFLDRLSDRERALFREAAVMGFVQGLMRPWEEGCPKNSQIVALVVQEALSFPDLYPAIHHIANEEARDGNA